jgi:hypothetical protein
MGRSHAKSKSIRSARRHLASTVGVENEEKHRNACLARLHESVARRLPSDSVARLQQLLGGTGAASTHDANPRIEVEERDGANEEETAELRLGKVVGDKTNMTAKANKKKFVVADKGMGKSFGKKAGSKAVRIRNRSAGKRKFKF